MNLFHFIKKCIDNNLLKLINTIILTLLSPCISSVFPQNTTIVFNTKKNSKISICKEIDNTYTRILTDEINTDSMGTAIYNWDVNDFQFMSCYFFDGWSTNFPIIQGSHLTITYKGEGQFEFTGTDKAAIEYNKSRKEFNRSFLNSSFNFPTESGYKNYSQFIEKHYSILSNGLDSLAAKNAISPKFSDILKNDFNVLIIFTAIETYQNKYLENKAIKVNNIDSIKIEHSINEILDKISPLIDSGEILKYPLSNNALAIYYANKYKYLKEKDKELILNNTLTNYLKPNKIGYLLAPQELQYKLLSLELLENCENAVTTGNSAIFEYISRICPQNAFQPHLKEKMEELLASIRTDHSEIKYIENAINTLEDLSKVDILDQKILYIDIWATWCGPCIGEFKHKDEIHELLLNYKDIVPVYISIDEDNNDTVWKEKTKAFNLNGYHLRANNKLVTYINEKLYEGKGIGIPRYILLDKNGNILEKNLSHPSNIDKLKQELYKHFK